MIASGSSTSTAVREVVLVGLPFARASLDNAENLHHLLIDIVNEKGTQRPWHVFLGNQPWGRGSIDPRTHVVQPHPRITLERPARLPLLPQLKSNFEEESPVIPTLRGMFDYVDRAGIRAKVTLITDGQFTMPKEIPARPPSAAMVLGGLTRGSSGGRKIRQLAESLGLDDDQVCVVSPAQIARLKTFLSAH